MLSPDARIPTDLETYLTRSLSFTLLTLALLTILLSGALPLSSPVAETEHSPYAFPTTFITATFHATSTVYMYTNYMSSGSTALVLGMIGSGFMSCFGVWALMFGEGEGGGKSRVSGWPFRNEEERRAKREKVGRRKGL